MVLYIHGFAGSGLGVKAKMVREFFTPEALAPSLPCVPDLAVDTLDQILRGARRRNLPAGLVGSSLGGYYALYLAERYKLPAVLINPSIRPWETLAAHTGTVTHYYDGTRFLYEPRHLEALKRYYIPRPTRQERYLLMLQSGDEVLDYRVALEHLPRAQRIVEEGGDHSFAGFERHLPRIREFFRRQGALESNNG